MSAAPAALGEAALSGAPAGPGVPTPGRRAAQQLLQRVRDGDLADRAFERLARRLDTRERAWALELGYGALRLRGRLDYLLERQVRGGVAALEPAVLDVLRLGAYQLLEMDGVPAYAAVSQAVEMVREAGAARAAGLVNGVLQNLRRRREPHPFPDPDSELEDYLVHWGSHPAWLVRRWIERWGAEQARALVEANNRRPELYLRPLGIDPSDAAARLAAEGMQSEPVSWSPGSLRLLPPAGAAAALGVIPAVVQDPAATLVARYAAFPAGASVLDLCAAPGGKALALAEGAARVVAADLSPRRLGRVVENAARIGWGERVGAVVADARQPPFRAAGAVLLDAPCTGTGTLRRHPDGRWRVTVHDLDSLALLQAELLRAAAPLVAPGGVLLYATCSLEREENETRVEEFLAQNPDFTLQPPAGFAAGELDAAGRLCVLPQRHGADGAFAARLRRRA